MSEVRNESMAEYYERSEVGTPSAEHSVASLAETIAARRKLIRNEARCLNCGTTQEECRAGWGTDDPGPEGLCCTYHCRHVVSTADMDALMDEVARGQVRTAEEVLASRPKRRPEDRGKPVSIGARFDQGEWWKTKDGRWLRIANMSPGHRYNTAAMLMRSAWMHAFRYVWDFAGQVDGHDGGDAAHDSLERALDHLTAETDKDPRAWLRSTTLYKALTDGLTIHGEGEASWQANGRDPVTGEPCEVPPILPRVCEIPACGCSGEAHS